MDFKVPKALSNTPTPTPSEGQFPASSYVEPKWSCKPEEENFAFEVLKNGQIIETVKDLHTKAFWSFGRLPTVNDIELAHPTISRFHAVLQYRGRPQEDATDESEDKPKVPEPGWYIYDLGSTHGTFVNKQKVPHKTYVRLRVGYMLKLGASTRSYILLGPNHDEEEVQVETITEMKEKRQKAIEEILLKQEQQRLEAEEKVRAKEAEGISWGMADDAEDEPDLSVNPFAINSTEELHLDDPKKTLRGFFEREGLDLEYKTEDLPNQTFMCKVELPLDDDLGRPIVAQVTHKGKKKDCVAQCALEACRILDRYGVLRKANQEAAVRRKRANSGSDGDDDFLDRTGDIEKRRKRKAQTQENSALTYEELLQQEKDLQTKIKEIEERITASKSSNKKTAPEEDTDDLDAYMSQLGKSDTKVDKVEIKKYRLEQQALHKDLKQVQRLIEITRPLDLPTIKMDTTETPIENKNIEGKGPKQPLFGKKLNVEVKAPGRVDGMSSEDVKMKENVEENVEEFDEEEKEVEKRSEVREKEPPKPSIPLIVKEPQPDKRKPESQPEVIKEKETEKAEMPSEDSQAKKKSRSRIRMRKQVRDNVDMEETAEETEEKFTDWLPPTNQSGDGTTSLNEKLGY